MQMKHYIIIGAVALAALIGNKVFAAEIIENAIARYSTETDTLAICLIRGDKQPWADDQFINVDVGCIEMPRKTFLDLKADCVLTISQRDNQTALSCGI